MPHQLDRLSDEDVIAYAVSARAAGEREAMRDGLAVLANRRLGDLVRRARIKVPAEDAEDVAMQALGDAVLSSFEGRSVGEFVKLMRTVLARRIADHYKRAERSPDITKLPDEHHGDDDEVARPDVAIEADETGRVEVQDVVDRALDELNPEHRRTVELYVFQDLSAQDVADQVNGEFPDSNPKMSVDNVQQIASRFRKRLRGLLEDG